MSAAASSAPPAPQPAPGASPSWLGRIPLFAMAVVVAGVMLIVVLLWTSALLRSWGDYRFGLAAIPLLLAIAYVNEYRKLPYEPWPPRPAPAAPAPAAIPVAESPPPTAAASAAAEEEPFEDPVEEADRLAADPTAPPPGDDR